MKSTIALILVAAILAPIVVKNMVILSFYANRERIAKELCVERTVKNSCCKGACVLEKDLKKVENEKEEFPAPFKDKTEIVYIVHSNEISAFEFDYSRSYFVYENVSYYDSFSSDILHPPAL
jgi:hypothetical protein